MMTQSKDLLSLALMLLLSFTALVVAGHYNPVTAYGFDAHNDASALSQLSP